MLHTKLQGNRSSGSGEEYFKGFDHIEALRPLGHVTSIMLVNVPESLHIKFRLRWSCGF